MRLNKYERLLLQAGAVMVGDGKHRCYEINGEWFTLSRSKRMTSCQEHTFVTKLRRAIRKGKVTSEEVRW